MVRKIIKWVGIVIVVGFIGMQFKQPDRTNPPLDESKTIYALLNVKPEVKAILDRSCTDCHSHNTTWPWYSYIAPASWLVADDVKEGRKHLNLSDWAHYKPQRAIARLDQICQELQDDKMPIKPYRLMHPNTVLTKQEIDLICAWVETTRDSIMAADTTQNKN